VPLRDSRWIQTETDKGRVLMDIRFLGHACFELTDGDTRVLIDPFLTGNPKAAAKAEEMEPTHIFLTHGHADHIGDTVDIAKRTDAQVVAIVEIAGELQEDGVQNVVDPNLGGTVQFDGGWVRLVPAWHTSTTPKGTVNTPAGLVVNLGGKTVYHLGDTALFSDLKLVADRDDVDVALMCIGGHYTMDRHDAVTAADLVQAKTVIPCHYNTFPPIETDAEAFKSDVKAGEVVILDPGQTHSI
jgi:L-ascorbate metabolism protein UlaG (beta-lactamase superfamily)